jgi:hypothetical protein
MLASVELKKTRQSKHLPVLNLYNATDLFPQVSYQLSQSSWSPGTFFPALNQKFKVELR